MSKSELGKTFKKITKEFVHAIPSLITLVSYTAMAILGLRLLKIENCSGLTALEIHKTYPNTKDGQKGHFDWGFTTKGPDQEIDKIWLDNIDGFEKLTKNTELEATKWCDITDKPSK
ncbi:MAG: hypothetical protein UR56_C0029G0017 [Candidatus Roizmanbacteria bacterium GW2011_GWC2_34_23]|uniref:Uncharacterized protein n=1 Tax=Candidatus Roizmanbacteria bacterium GW2011_GWC2_34_23 TaxID=1618484 RepID=A0A0G0ASV6_9BACT|nr:MAG: hypothetical protein UR56_C0029G0017 [Candidatus Roizmanbacteria bacterium GW2011_GWC2_34_23]